MLAEMDAKKPTAAWTAIAVAALGYFVDIYDLLLFGIVRKPSLAALGLDAAGVLEQGERIIGIQMIGLLAGGFLWGIMGDKKGRLSVLFGSILLYSLANIANGFVVNADQYAWCRFIAGIGLAGELGAGITLVSELVPKEKRGVATSFVAGIGLLGAVFAFLVRQWAGDWRICYFIGGGMGLLLLMMRVSVFESEMFGKVKDANGKRGDIGMILRDRERFFRYLKCVAVGLPNWFVIGVLISFSDKFAQELGLQGTVDPGRSIMFAYIGISLGDISIGMISQWLQSRKKALYLYYGLSVVFIFFYLTQHGSANGMYWWCGMLGFGIGFWAIFVTMAAEMFGTNLRATAATTIPNIVRGTLPLIIYLFKTLRESLGYVQGAAATGAICVVLGLIAVFGSTETFGRDLDFTEE